MNFARLMIYGQKGGRKVTESLRQDDASRSAPATMRSEQRQRPQTYHTVSARLEMGWP